MDRNREKRNINRVNIPGMKIQLCMDDSKNLYDPVKRDVKDISHKGLAFNVLKHDYVTANKHYNFIIEVDNKSIGGVGLIKYVRSGLAGMAFSFIDSNQIQSLSHFLDPAYIAKTLELSDDSSKAGIKYIRYSAEAGSFIEYKSNGEKESLCICFLDKRLEWTSNSGLVLKIYDEFSKDYVKIVPDTSIYMNILSQTGIFVAAAKLDTRIRSILKKIFNLK